MSSKRPLVGAINNDAAFLHLLQALLHEEGYDVLLIQTGDIALDTVKQRLPKMIILDIDATIPNASWKVADLLTLDPETTDIPLIICSIADETLAARKAKLTTAGSLIIEKPFNLNELMEAVRKRLNNRPF